MPGTFDRRISSAAAPLRLSPQDLAVVWLIVPGAAGVPASLALGSLAEADGITLVQMAIAFAVNHPAVTSTIIGPRTMDHLDAYLADGTNLPSELLDRIDQIVSPGVTVNAEDNMWETATTAITTAFRRR